LGHDLLIDTVHRFQGDECDVMLFSPVISKDSPKGAIGFLSGNGNLFNVAVTRARAALVVVGDRNAARSEGVEYLAKFVGFIDGLKDDGRSATGMDGNAVDHGPIYPNVSRPELVSDWEKRFYVELYREGLRPIPQYDVEKYILDFALVQGDRRLNIEVDGERYHRAWNGELLRRDQLRNMRMIELGWDVMRFWVYELRDDMPGCIARVKCWANAAHSN
jgi:very-short-patch-repair endonuclease